MGDTLNIKVHGGTRSGDELCRSCINAHMHRGATQGQEVIMCQAIYDYPQRITYPVVECNEYRDANLPSLTQMEKVAWFINADQRTGKVGFVRGDKVTEAMKEEVEDPF